MKPPVSLRARARARFFFFFPLSLLPLFAVAGMCGPVHAQPAQTVRIACLDVEDPYTTLPSLKEGLEAASVKTARLRPEGSFIAADQEVLFIGSFATGERKAGLFLRQNAGRIRRFVEQGGIVVELAQSVRDEPSPPWLPEGLKARRGSRDCAALAALEEGEQLLTQPSHVPLDALAGGEVFRGKRYYAPSVLGATDLFVEVSGFRTMLVEPGSQPFPALMAARAGKGLIVLTALSPDRLCVHGATPAAQAAGCALLGNLAAYATNAARRPPEVVPQAAFSATPSTLRVEVFVDADGDGRRAEKEAPFPGAIVSHGFDELRTGGDGAAELVADPANPRQVWLRIPDGHLATTAWHVSSAAPPPLRFGIRPAPSGQSRPRSTIYHLTDVHLGRLDLPSEREAFHRFLLGLDEEAGEGDLVAVTGDLTHTGSLAELSAFAAEMEGLGRPHFSALGNHDWGKGPDGARFYEMAVAPAFSSREWNGYLLLSLPSLPERGEAAAWLKRNLAEAVLPVLVFVHEFPLRSAFDRLPPDKVGAVFSGHWHGDLVSSRHGIHNVSTPSLLMGGWDFSPGSARRVVLEGRRVVATELMPVGGGAQRPTPSPSPGGEGGAQGREAGSGAGLTHVWTSAVPGRVLRASPAVAGKLLLAPFRGHTGEGLEGGLCALRLEDGSLAWCHDTTSPVTVQPVVVGSTVVFGEVDGTMWGLAAEDGAVRWTTELDDALPPTFVQHFMHAPGLRRGDGIYYCYQTAPFGIRAGDGRIVWTGAPFGAADAFSHARGVVTGDSLLCAGFLGPLVKYALRSEGKAPRTVLAKRHVTADMTVQGAIWMLTRSSLVRLDRDSFNVVGAFRVPYAILPAGPSVDSGGAVIPFGYEGLARFDTATGKREWMVPIPEGPLNFALNMDRGVGQIGGLAAARGKLYAPGLDGTLRVLDLRSGQERGRAEVGVPLVSTPTLEGDRVFVADYSGAVHCFH